MRQVKVIHIITRMELGGAQQNTLYTISHLDEQKFLPYLITGRGGELFAEALGFKNTLIAEDLVREVRPLRDVMAFFQLCRLIKNIAAAHPAAAPVIVHTHSSKAGILGRWAARCVSIPIIIHSIHGFGFHDYQSRVVRDLFILIEKITAPITTKFIAVSAANQQKGVALHLFSSEKVVVIRSGIEITRFQNPAVSRSQFRCSLNIPETAPVIAMIACLKPQKAPLDFIKVCDSVAKELPDARFILVGDGVLREAVENEIEGRKLRHCMHLLGWRNDIPEILKAIDVLVLTSLWEGLPRVFPQALVAGVPVVATRVDGASEAIKDGVNGFLLDPGDVEGLARKTISLIQSPLQLSSMEVQNRQIVAEFDIQRMVSQQEALYKDLLSDQNVFFNGCSSD
jgi:glycosyltransferase involved in cell wall biosynthesis